MKEFLRLLKMDLTRAFVSKSFLLAVAFTICVFAYGTVGMVQPNASVVEAFKNTYLFNNIDKMFFLVATVAYSASFCVDWQSKYYYSVISRGSICKYGVSKYMATLLAGGISLMVGMLIFFLILSIKQPVFLPSPEMIEVEMSGDAFADVLMTGNIGAFILLYCFQFFIMGGFAATLGLCISVYMPNKYIAYIMPFIVAFVLNQTVNILDIPNRWDVFRLSTGTVRALSTTDQILHTVCIFSVLFVGMGVIFVRKLKWRIGND
ncbi:MAG: hypothetical protein K6G65_10885 [Lachnospiraceae bacterium]|nr:hypothetical protein [Lachnospiraceae bacterium]